MASSLKLTPLSKLHFSAFHIPSHNGIPNNPSPSHPLYIYHAAFPASTSPSTLETHLQTVSVCSPQWRYTMYQQTHFHSTTHELLLPYQGRARLCFGGESNPGRVEAEVGAGDVIVVPAGVGHRLLEDLSGGPGDGFMMVGAYPKGCSWDMCYGKPGEEEKAKACKDVKWFEKDPVYGDKGPVLGNGGIRKEEGN